MFFIYGLWASGEQIFLQHSRSISMVNIHVVRYSALGSINGRFGSASFAKKCRLFFYKSKPECVGSKSLNCSLFEIGVSECVFLESAPSVMFASLI